MSAIAEFRTAILKILDDAAQARFTNDQVDQGLRQALNEYSRVRPLTATRSFDGCGEVVIELPADFQPVRITQVEFHDEAASPQVDLPFVAYYRDSQWSLDLLNRAISSMKSIDVTFTMPHFIDGLDGGAGTSVPAEDEALLQIGAAGFAALYRAVSRAESVNLQPELSKKLQDAALGLLHSFREGIRKPAGSAFATLPPIPADTF